nr:UDP-2,3-diacylglucosamine diphosphatase [Salinibacter grassmerensis]
MVDGWVLRRSWYWPASHNAVLRALLERARRADVVYVPGNHDEAARQFRGLCLGGITIETEVVHTTADGRRLLVLHGDEFDGVVRHAQWASKLGGWAYERLLTLSRYVNRVRWWMDLPYWSLAAAAKKKSKRAVQYVADFEEALATQARDRGIDGVVCGHIHVPALRRVQGVAYANTGDWVEHCTALVEDMDGALALRRWAEWSPDRANGEPENEHPAGSRAAEPVGC